MRTFLLLVLGLVLVAGPVLLPLQGAGWAPDSQVMAQDNTAEDMTRDDETPLDEFDPEEASWEAWAGPLLIGLFGLFLAFMIYRFTLRGKNRKRDKQEPSD